ncbi:MAG: hypothetical protein V3U76_01475 [Granulosicoccus sp.]
MNNKTVLPKFVRLVVAFVMLFTLSHTWASGYLPRQVELVSPGGPVTDMIPAYVWRAAPTASWYYLWVNDKSGNRIKQWLTANEVGCSDGTGTCTFASVTSLDAGPGRWWVQAWNSDGYGPWSDAMEIAVGGDQDGAPGASTLVSPGGSLDNNSPEYIWNAVAAASWYYLWVDDSSGNRIEQWLTANEVSCSDGTGTCTFNSATALDDGPGRWSIQAWNGEGYGLWSSAMEITVNDVGGVPRGAGIDCVEAPAFEPPAFDRTVRIANELALQKAVAELQSNTRLLIAPGTYKLSRSLLVHADNITISGDSERCDEVILIGSGMDEWHGDQTVEYGIWSDSTNLAVSNLTIEQVYFHGIIVNGNSDSPILYNVRLQDSGEQLLKSNPLGFADGVDSGLVEYSSFGYTEHPPLIDHGGGTGYTHAIDVHGGKDWMIRNNLFENIHTPDWTDHLWNAAVLMWRGSSNTVLENNRFHNVDRAIAFGLEDRPMDHRGGIIRNNMITMDHNFLSYKRKAEADAMIIVWSSPNTMVLHNTILTQGNTPKSIELRFNSEHTTLVNNLTDALISVRNDMPYIEKGNLDSAKVSEFLDVGEVNLRLNAPYLHYLNKGEIVDEATHDVDGMPRQSHGEDWFSDIGASEWVE